METPDDYSYAPASPGRCSFAYSMNFYSIPTSPKACTPYGYLRTPSEYSTPTMTPPYQDANSHYDDFEFETSRSFCLDAIDYGSSQKLNASFDRKERGQRQSLTMAFADELFCHGKLMALAPPLKLPPRLRQKKNGNQSPAPSSPGSASFALKLPFSYQRLWNDEFDPFVVALENVREEKRVKASKQKKQAGLLTPPVQQLISPTPNAQNQNQLLDSPSAHYCTSLPEPVMKQVARSHTSLALPKGVDIARQVRLIQGDHVERRSELCMAISLPTVKTPENKIAQESGVTPCARETKGSTFKRFFSSASIRKGDDKDKKQRYQSSALVKKPTFLRRLSFKSGGSVHCNGEKTVSHQLSKVPRVHYRPGLLLCMGYRARYAK